MCHYVHKTETENENQVRSGGSACYASTQEAEVEGSKPVWATNSVLSQLELPWKPWSLNKTIAKMKPKGKGNCHKIRQLKSTQQTFDKSRNKEINCM